MLTAVWLFWAGTAAAEGDPPLSELNTAKAAFVFNFLKYASWPETVLTRTEFFTICLLDVADPLAQEVRALANRVIAGRKVVVRMTSLREDDFGRCHLILIGTERMDKALATLTGGGALLVSDAPNFVRKGGMIGLTLYQGHLQFDINTEALSNTTFKLDGRLLGLALNARRER